MAKNETIRPRPGIVQEDKDALSAIAGFTPVYAPANAAFSLSKLQTAKTDMETAQALEVQKAGEAAAARDAAVAKEWAFHNAMLDAKTQVQAQYGKDSDQLQALGLKKKSEYAAPVRKAKSAAK